MGKFISAIKIYTPKQAKTDMKISGEVSLAGGNHVYPANLLQ